MEQKPSLISINFPPSTKGNLVLEEVPDVVCKYMSVYPLGTINIDSKHCDLKMVPASFQSWGNHEYVPT